MAIVNEWRRAFARQARADLRARECLLRCAELPDCHQLHFLQMACEKLCKAHLLDRGSERSDLESSHAYIANTLPIIAREVFARDSGRQPKDRSWMLHAIRTLARRIELLAPAVDDGGRVPQNTEYPWQDGAGEVHAPADGSLQVDLLHAPAGRQLIKILTIAVDDLLGLES